MCVEEQHRVSYLCRYCPQQEIKKMTHQQKDPKYFLSIISSDSSKREEFLFFPPCFIIYLICVKFGTEK